jgi:signal transduction histidine kinase
MSFLGTPSTAVLARAPFRFGIALLATSLALVIALALHSYDTSASYVTTLAAIAFSTWCCGTAPSIASIALSLVGIDYEFILPAHSLRIEHRADWSSLLVFLLAALLIVLIGEASRLERERLREASGELEEKVRSRTGELDHANESLRQLTARLLNLQDDERRRIARELHDNAGQALAALAMNLGAVAKDLDRLVKTAGTVADSASLVQEMSNDIRTMSYLLHPPMLDETGLAPALRWYVDGFAERSKIAVELDCGQDLGRLSREVETAVFRLVQECLTNIHRHSGSPTATIRIARLDGIVRVDVKDHGQGLTAEKRELMVSGGTVGVGIRGIRERVRQLGGTLEISSEGIGAGTCILVRLPAAEVTRIQETSHVNLGGQIAEAGPAGGPRQLSRATGS